MWDRVSPWVYTSYTRLKPIKSQSKNNSQNQSETSTKPVWTHYKPVWNQSEVTNSQKLHQSADTEEGLSYTHLRVWHQLYCCCQKCTRLLGAKSSQIQSHLLDSFWPKCITAEMIQLHKQHNNTNRLKTEQHEWKWSRFPSNRAKGVRGPAFLCFNLTSGQQRASAQSPQCTVKGSRR